ncbi:metal ABC transporter ATP-binding protein [Lederbergia sp. NSJ-179]|uniref:metal ABC transporter ATP-binding protein n=1 Tax=Lederbergia sp. NSJ-179 TaxID=2931402 RepID=UPI001FD536CD|nr:metal ABC transporter ATP-binding protein [Lederbergia sp. NSJ-179]MCJ7841628.1 metal ABC transporter ATP-binding protein [Lederbergia sp. NSJ-179]
MNLITMENIVFGYSHVPVINDVSLDIRSGEFVGITGQNGAAKSTLLRIMLGLLKPWHGKIMISKKNDKGRRLKVAYVPQQIASFNVGFPSTVLELVKSGRFQKGKWFKRLKRTDEALVRNALEMVGMWEYRHHKIGSLSGGQKQKICIARAYVSEPDVFVLDEPTTGMDVESRMEFYQFMHLQIKAHDRTVIMVTHDLDEVQDYLDKHIRLERGEDGEWKCLISASCNEHSGLVDSSELLLQS